MGKAIGNSKKNILLMDKKNPLPGEDGKANRVRIKPLGSVLVLFLILLILVSSGFITKDDLTGEIAHDVSVPLNPKCKGLFKPIYLETMEGML